MSAQKKKGRFDGYVMLIVGALLIYIGGIFDNTPNWAHHQLLVSTADTKGSVFDQTVILMLQHRKSGSFGLVVNKPDKSGEFYVGGPMEPEKVYALHSTDVTFPDSVVMKDIQTAVLEGKDSVAQLTKAAQKPKWYIILHGYAGWGKRQLNSELAYSTWHVVKYDEKLVRETKPDAMWAEANKRPLLSMPSN